MSYLEQVTEEIKGAAGNQEQPAETVSSVPESQKPQETNETVVNDAQNGTVEPNEQKPPKPDLSTLSKEEKAQHGLAALLAFKQFGTYESCAGIDFLHVRYLCLPGLCLLCPRSIYF